MNPRIISVQVLPEYQLKINFISGESKVFDVRPYLDIGIFQELKDPHYFSMVNVCDGTISWPHGQDFCPDTLYEKSNTEPLHATNFGNAKRLPL